VTGRICRDLIQILRTIDRPGDFCTSGRIAVHPPALEIEGVGRISLPLPESQARQLIEVAEPAPYGRGAETVLDPDYRRTWQIDAERIRLRGAAWQRDLDAIVRHAAEGLGVEGSVKAQLYKLLVYDQGCFFLPHRDSEKAAGMFATLVVVLPSEYQGGELVVEHQRRRVVLDLRQADPAEVSYAAFYADCRHEVKPVTAGYRLALVFNLLRPKGKRLPRLPEPDQAITRLAKCLSAWDDDPDKLVHPLEHAYTEAELAFTTLKGKDRAVAEALAAAAKRCGCELYLTLFTVEESGWAEYGGRWNEYEIGEVIDSEAVLHTWRSPDDRKLPFGRLPFDPEELCPPEAWERIEEQEPEFMEASGNEGVTFERLYHGAALVVWPQCRREAILRQAPLAFSLAYLEERLRVWCEAGQPTEQKAELISLFLAVIAGWPDVGAYYRYEERPIPRMTALLTRLAEPSVVREFLERLAQSGFETKDVPSLIELLSLGPTEHAVDTLGRLLSGNVVARPQVCGRLLRDCLRTGRIPATALRPAAEVLIAALPGDASGRSPASAPRWLSVLLRQSGPSPEPLTALVADLLPVLDAIAPDLGQAALAHFRANPKTYDLDGVLRPAALRLVDDPDTQRTGSVVALRDRVAESLRRRTAEPPAPPTDWRRSAELSCTCPHCQDLARFLNDPDRSQWELKAVKQIRSHVEEVIRKARCDLDCQTIRRGSPHTLRCVKSDASYRRALKDYEQMRADLKRLTGKT